MDTYKPKRYFSVFDDDEMIEDIVVDIDGNEHVVTLSGKQWKDYDWILNRYDEIAKRIVNNSLFIRKREQKSTLSLILGTSISLFVEGYNERKGKPIDPKEGTHGNA